MCLIRTVISRWGQLVSCSVPRGGGDLIWTLMLPSSVCVSELCPRHSPLDPTPHTLVQPISAILASDPSSCPRCQREAGRRPSGLASTDSGQEGSAEAEANGDGPQSSEDGVSSGLEKEEEQEDGAARLCGDVWRETRAKLRGIVDSKYFNRGIMMAILVNTVSMGIEHHEQASEGTGFGLSARGGAGWARMEGHTYPGLPDPG